MKIMTRTISMLFAASLAIFPAAGQESPEVVNKVIRLQHTRPENVTRLLQRWTEGRLVPSDALGLVSVSGSAEEVTRIEEAIRTVDVPRAVAEVDGRQNVELTVYFLGVDDQGQGEAFDGPLGAVVEQLKHNFPYRGYRLLETLVARGRTGRPFEVNGALIGDQNSLRPSMYQFRSLVDGVSGEGDSQSISLTNLRAGMRSPVQLKNDEFKYTDLGVNTDIDIPPGKLVVVGKAGTKASPGGMFVVVSARVVE